MRRTAGQGRGGVLGAVLVAGLLGWGAIGFAGHGLAAQQVNSPGLGRSVHGIVSDAAHRPLSIAIVYLTDTQAKSTETVITGDDGSYSFHRLQPRHRYEVHAVWKGHSSPVRVDSQYEIAPDIRLDLQVPVG